MNYKERKKLKQREFLLKTGKMQPKQNYTEFRKTEDGSCYHFGSQTANAWDGWSRDQRDAGKQPTFKEFYEQLRDEYKITVTVIPINTTSNE